jgi:hypothetical protein
MIERRFVGVSMGIVSLLFLMAACGGGGTAASGSASPSPTLRRLSPAEYVAGVCGAATAWESAVQADTTQFETQSKSASSLDEGKALFVAYVGQVVKETLTMVTTVTGLGAPTVNNGAQIRTAVIDSLGKIETIFQDAVTKAQQVDTSSPAAYSQGVQKVGADIESTLSNLGDPLANLPSPELEQAAKANPDCQKLESS